MKNQNWAMISGWEPVPVEQKQNVISKRMFLDTVVCYVNLQDVAWMKFTPWDVQIFRGLIGVTVYIPRLA